MAAFRKRKVKKRSIKDVGLSPGTLTHVAPEDPQRKLSITAFEYTENDCKEHAFLTVTEAYQQTSARIPQTTLWLNIDGIPAAKELEDIGQRFSLHPLTLEDITHLDQRPKQEELDNYLYIVLTMLLPNAENKSEIVSEQVSIILGKDYVLSLQELPSSGDVFDIIRNRLRSGKGKMRKLGADYLAYALVDAVVDYYYLILEDLGSRIDALEEELISAPRQETLRSIYSLKRELLYVRRAVWPLREVVSGLQRNETELISDATKIYLKDVYDHVIQVMDSVETYRELLANMLDIYLSSISQRMNAVMKVLTVIATIFMPLTFIAGVYGMNFKFMPELEMTYGYPVTLLLMLLITVFMLLWFWRKGWLSADQ